MDAGQLAGKADPAGAGLSGRGGARRTSRRQLASFPPLVFAGEARKLKTRARQGRGRRGFPAAGRRLRRELRRASRRQHPRLLPRLPADGGGAHLRRRVAGGEGRPHRRPVRQAALVRRPRRSAASSCRATAATSSTASSSRRRRARPIRARQIEAYRQSAATLNLLRAFAHGRLRQPRERASLDARLRRRTARSARRYEALADRITETLDFMRAIGIDPETHPELRSTDFYTSHEALLLGYEQAMTRVEFDLGRLVRDLGPHDLDRRPHAPARPRACRVSAAASRTRSA